MCLEPPRVEAYSLRLVAVVGRLLRGGWCSEVCSGEQLQVVAGPLSYPGPVSSRFVGSSEVSKAHACDRMRPEYLALSSVVSSGPVGAVSS